MITKQSTCSASFKEIGETIQQRGVYSVAKISVQNSFKDNEVCTILEQSKTIKEPIFKQATRSIKLSNSFLELCLTRPKKPHSSATYKEWDFYNEWNKISKVDKVRFQLEKLAHDLNSELISFEIL